MQSLVRVHREGGQQPSSLEAPLKASGLLSPTKELLVNAEAKMPVKFIEALRMKSKEKEAASS